LLYLSTKCFNKDPLTLIILFFEIFNKDHV